MVDIDTLLDTPIIYRTEFPDNWRVDWRPLTLKEYRIFSALRSNGTTHAFMIYKQVFERCYIGDTNFISTNMPIFIPMTIGALVMYISGDCHNQTIVNEISMARESYIADEFLELMKRIICSAFPNQNYKDLDGISRPALIEQFVIAEAQLKWTTGGKYQPFDLSKIYIDNGTTIPNAPDEAIEFVNFEEENSRIMPKLNLEELDEASIRMSKQVKINPEQARQLDRMHR